MQSDIFEEHPYSALSQSQANSNRLKSLNKENSKPKVITNFHKQTPNTSSGPQQALKRTLSMRKNTNYDEQAYKDKIVYPTARSTSNTPGKSILKNRQQANNQRSSKLDDRIKWSNENVASTRKSGINQLNDDAVKRLKFFSGSIKSIKFLTKKFNKDSRDPKLIHAGAYAFEIIAILDSSVFDNSSDKSKEFTIKDSSDRMACVYYEIDMSMKKLTRGTYVRLTGIYNISLELFNCYSVRQATQYETFTHENNVSITNAYIKKKIFLRV